MTATISASVTKWRLYRSKASSKTPPSVCGSSASVIPAGPDASKEKASSPAVPGGPGEGIHAFLSSPRAIRILISPTISSYNRRKRALSVSLFSRTTVPPLRSRRFRLIRTGIRGRRGSHAADLADRDRDRDRRDALPIRTVGGQIGRNQQISLDGLISTEGLNGNVLGGERVELVETFERPLHPHLVRLDGDRFEDIRRLRLLHQA